MSSVNHYRSRMIQVHATINKTFGERTRITPSFVKPNFPPMLYAEEAVELLGVWHTKPKTIFDSVGNAMHARVESHEVCVSFARADLPWLIRHGDEIARCCDGSAWEVTGVNECGTGRVFVDLTCKGKGLP